MTNENCYTENTIQQDKKGVKPMNKISQEASNELDYKWEENFPKEEPSEVVEMEQQEAVEFYTEFNYGEKLLELANLEKYEEYLEAVFMDNPFWSKDCSFQEQVISRFLSTVSSCEEPLLVLENLAHEIFAEVGEDPFPEMSEEAVIQDQDFLSTMAKLAIDQDNIPLLDWLVYHSTGFDPVPYLDRAVLRQSLESVDYVLSHCPQMKVSPAMLFIWGQNHTGNPQIDNCVAIMANYFFPEEMERVNEDGFPYPMVPFEDLFLLEQSSPEQSQIFRGICLEVFLPTPYMQHCIRHDLLSKENRNILIQNTEKTIDYLFRHNSYYRNEISHAIEVVGSDEKTILLNFKIHPDIYQESVNLFEVLLKKFPKTAQRKKVRCLLAALALVDHPAPEIVERVGKFKGTHLEITQLPFPWFGKVNHQNEEVVSDNLFKNWEKVMPKHMKPAINYSTEIRCPIFDDMYVDLELWLTHCDVLGHPPGYKLSQVACEILHFPCNHPLFLNALEPDGILWKEKTEILEFLNKNQDQYHGHYLVSLSLLKEEKSYAL